MPVREKAQDPMKKEWFVLHTLTGKENKVLETLTLEEYREFSDLIDSDVFEDIDLNVCVEKRISEGGTSVSSVEKQIKFVKEKLDNI